MSMVKKVVDFNVLSVAQKADFLGKNADGFALVSERATEQGALVVEYTYEDWSFTSTALILPLMDTGFCQIVLAS